MPFFNFLLLYLIISGRLTRIEGIEFESLEKCRVHNPLCMFQMNNETGVLYNIIQESVIN